MKRWKIAIPVLVIGLFVAWYAFRPERLVANHRVNEAFPTATNGAPAQALDHVYMVAADDAKDDASVQRAGFIDLGAIKGNIGDQNYTLGREVDLPKFRAVSIWCKRFSVKNRTIKVRSCDVAEVGFGKWRRCYKAEEVDTR